MGKLVYWWPRRPQWLEQVYSTFNGANFQAAIITRGSAWSKTWFNLFHYDLGDSNRLLVWTNMGKLVSWWFRGPLRCEPFYSTLKGANSEAAIITRGSARLETEVIVYHDDLGDSNRLLVWTSVGKLVYWWPRGPLCF